MKNRVCIGVYVKWEEAQKPLSWNCKTVIRWYGFPFLAWKWAKENLGIHWFNYPLVIGLILKHWLLFMLRGDEVR